MSMHLSMHNWMRSEPIETTIRRLAKYDYGSIGIGGEPDRYDTKEVRGLLDEHGVDCYGCVTLMFEGLDLIAAEEKTRVDSVQYVKDCVTMVKELEGNEVTVIPSTVGKIEPTATPEEEWDWAVEGLREIYHHAQKEGVRLAIEPLCRFETYFINRGEQALTLANEVGENCGICLDTFHMTIEEEDMYDTIMEAGDRLLDFHVADNNRMPPGLGGHDWLKIVGTLRTIGYDGALTVEFVAPIDRTPANPYPNAVETEPVDISPEQKKFIEDHGSSLLSEEFYDWLVEQSAETMLPLIRKTG